MRCGWLLPAPAVASTGLPIGWGPREVCENGAQLRCATSDQGQNQVPHSRWPHLTSTRGREGGQEGARVGRVELCQSSPSCTAQLPKGSGPKGPLGASPASPPVTLKQTCIAPAAYSSDSAWKAKSTPAVLSRGRRFPRYGAPSGDWRQSWGWPLTHFSTRVSSTSTLSRPSQAPNSARMRISVPPRSCALPA